MQGDDVFVKMMFNIVDKDGDGRISFQEFLDTVVLFSKGRTEDKLRIIFDMCDNDRNGVIDKLELSEMLRSLVEIARTNNSLSDSQVTELIDGMFQSAGLEHKNALTYDDFKLMMKEYRGTVCLWDFLFVLFHFRRTIVGMSVCITEIFSQDSINNNLIVKLSINLNKLDRKLKINERILLNFSERQ